MRPHSESFSGISTLENEIPGCLACPRLRHYGAEIAQTKRRAYREETYYGRPVPGFGDPHAPLWIVGLAPGAHGAHRTGRVFTGDRSGEWLYGALYRHGFSNQEHSHGPGDGLTLRGVYISCIVRCAPPENRPTPEEISNCSRFLLRERASLTRVRVVLTLGELATSTLLRIEAESERTTLPLLKFRHGLEVPIGDRTYLASYHPSQQNTFTGKLTREMWDTIFLRAKSLVET
jgi:uracil-DNA glycosylase family 4